MIQHPLVKRLDILIELMICDVECDAYCKSIGHSPRYNRQTDTIQQYKGLLNNINSLIMKEKKWYSIRRLVSRFWIWLKV